MFVVEVLVAAAVLVGIAFVASHDVRGLEDEEPDVADVGLPDDRLLRADDIPRLRFRVVSGFWGGARGYRYADVDEAMRHVEVTLRALERERAADTERPPA